MKLSKKLAAAIFGVAIVSGGLNLAKHTGVGGLTGISGLPSFVTSAQAKVGRPLSPVSVAGVARRN